MRSDQLERLAPEVDVDAALAVVLHDVRRRRRTGFALAAAILALLAIGIAAALGTGGNPDPTRPAARTVTREEQGVRITLTIDRARIRPGERVWADVTIENVGPVSIHWQAGGCGFPADLTFAPQIPTQSHRHPGTLWTGRLEELRRLAGAEQRHVPH